MYSVALDIGGTFLKVARISSSGLVGAVHRTAIPDFLDVTGAAREIDPGALMAAVRRILESVLEQGPVNSVFLTGQMAGLAFVSDAGEALAPLISWQDERGNSVDQVREALGAEATEELGDGLRPGSPLVTLQALGIPAGARVTSLLAYVAGALTGTRAPTVHITDAAAWGMYDLKNGRWSQAALSLIGISEQDLPTVTWELVPVGMLALDGHPEIPVMCAVGDQQSSLRGAGLGFGEFANAVSVNLATGCQVATVSDRWQSPAQSRPYFDRRYLHTVTHLPAGRMLTAALIRTRGATTESDWEWAAGHSTDPEISEAVSLIVHGVVDAVQRLKATGAPILFSGGLVQRYVPVREAIEEALNLKGSVFPGDDAALAGLAVLASCATFE